MEDFKLMVINDCHLGVKRSTGTTQESSQQLNLWQMQQFKSLVQQALSSKAHLLINGDLFDRFEVSKQCEFETFLILTEFLDGDKNLKLILSAGNHDLSTNSNKTSSFENLCRYLHLYRQDQVISVVGETKSITGLEDWFTVVSHYPNQTMFEDALNQLLEQGSPKYVFVHCNLMSPFAEHTDHSLNISQEMLDKFQQQGSTVVFAHEHNARTVGNAVVVGNQIPSSIADCLDENHSKQYAILTAKGLELKPFIKLSEVFKAVDWREEEPKDTLFIRITGQANYEESAQVIHHIAQVRQSNTAFVVGNAVQVSSIQHNAETTEQLSTFNIKKMILDELPQGLIERFNQVYQFLK